MSFIKKGIKKTWKFVKKNWKIIALVAAVVFTAGVATVGFGAFTAATAAGTAAGGAGMGFGGFMGAVGQTMWAGVAGTAGSMGIGSGATVPTTAASVAAGTAGTNVGLGAAWGAGGTYGMGKAGSEAALAAGKVGGTVTQAQAGAIVKATAAQTAKEAAVAAGTSGWGSSAAKAMPWMLAAAGPAMTALGQEDEYQNADIWGSNSGTGMPGRSALAVPDGSEGGAAAAGGPMSAADQVAQRQLQQRMRANRLQYENPNEDDGLPDLTGGQPSLMGGGYSYG